MNIKVDHNICRVYHKPTDQKFTSRTVVDGKLIKQEVVYICEECIKPFYCTICSSCGEDGCCPKEKCKGDPNGMYCEQYVRGALLDSVQKDEVDRWLNAENSTLNAKPIDLIKTPRIKEIFETIDRLEGLDDHSKKEIPIH